jgi:hypothetical protein
MVSMGALTVGQGVGQAFIFFLKTPVAAVGFRHM